jgi:hypothetical protein
MYSEKIRPISTLSTTINPARHELESNLIIRCEKSAINSLASVQPF